MKEYTILDEFSIYMTYKKYRYDARIKKMDGKGYFFYKVEYSFNGRNGIIPLLRHEMGIWDCEDFADKDMCREVGDFISKM